MKKFLLLFILFTGSLPVLFAKVDVLAGARVGMNLAHIRKLAEPEGYSKKIMLGSNFGGLVRVKFNKVFGLQTEILFSQKGQRWTQDLDSLDNYKKLVSNYIEFPLIGVARVGGEKIKAVFYLGAYFAYWSGGYYQNSSQQDNQTIASDNTDYPFSSGDQRFDAGIASGVGMDIKAGPGLVEIAVRHDFGLVDRSKIDEEHTKTYNCGLFFSAAYIIKIGK